MDYYSRLHGFLAVSVTMAGATSREASETYLFIWYNFTVHGNGHCDCSNVQNKVVWSYDTAENVDRDGTLVRISGETT